MTEEWCRQKLSALQIEDARLETLQEIRHRLTDDQPVEASVTTKILNSAELFDCLHNTVVSDQVELACDILSICLSSLDLDSSNTAQLLERTLNHNKPKVKALALNEIYRFLQKNSNVNSLEVNISLLVISCLEYDETDLGAMAVKILSITLKSDYDEPTVRSALLKMLEGRDVVRCRVYEIAINLAKFNSTMLTKVEKILNKTLAELETDDVLLQLNILELLVSLAEQNHGLVYLENHKIFEKINERIEHIEQNPIDQFLIPGFMKFFGKIAYSQPQKIIAGYPNTIQCLFDCLHSGDITILPTAFDTLGNLAHSSPGKILLEGNYSSKLKVVFEEFRNYLQNLPTDLKNRGFNALEVILKTEGPATNEICKITKKWCEHLNGSSNLQFILEFCKNPFPDIKISALSVIKTICEYPWGVIALKNTAGFIEFLLDRRIEFDKDARFTKYEIICILADSTIFDAQTLLQLRKYVNDGPHYVEGIVEVAVDGS